MLTKLVTPAVSGEFWGPHTEWVSMSNCVNLADIKSKETTTLYTVDVIGTRTHQNLSLDYIRY